VCEVTKSDKQDKAGIDDWQSHQKGFFASDPFALEELLEEVLLLCNFVGPNPL
jgi:hypothetical protein